jgi:hypothetical protein
MQTVKVTAVGDNVEIVLPKSALRHISLSGVTQLTVRETLRGIELTPCSDNLQGQLEVAEEVMDEDHEVLRKLAQ